MVCEACHGNGYFTPRIAGDVVRGFSYVTCRVCLGAGEIDQSRAAAWVRIGSVHRTWRMGRREGIAACAERMRIDPRDLQEMECGWKDPAPLLEQIPPLLREYEMLPETTEKAA